MYYMFTIIHDFLYHMENISQHRTIFEVRKIQITLCYRIIVFNGSNKRDGLVISEN